MISAATCRIDEQNPWPGLSAFDEAAEQFFNGRRNETAELRRLVLNSSLTVLFGASGLGKTSLIQAGLFPASRKEHFLPVYVRLDVCDRNDGPLIRQVTIAFQRQIAEQKVEAPPFREDESLWEYLHRPSLELWSGQNQLLTPMFVFDQFEEVFTLGAGNAAAIRQLRIDLADLIENRIPETTAKRHSGNGAGSNQLALDSQRYRVVLSFREDFLPNLEGWKRDLPSIARNRLRLLPMSQRRAFDAVYDTAPHLVNEKLAHDIVAFVAAAQDGSSSSTGETDIDASDVTVEPALLSLVCHGLNEKRKAQQKEAFDEELLKRTKESIISDFYKTSLADLPRRVRTFIANELITERGFRKPCDVDDAYKKYRLTKEQLRLLVDRRVVRIEPNRGTERVELTHDLLTRVVREDRDRSRRWRKRRKIFGYIAIPAILLSSWLGLAGQAKLAEQQRLELDLKQRASAAEAQALSLETQAKLARAEALAHQSEWEKKEAQKDAASAQHARTEMSVQLLASKAALKGTEGDSALPLSMLLAAESLRRKPLIDNIAILSEGLLSLPKPLGLLPNTKIQAVSFTRNGLLVTSEPGFIRVWEPLTRRQIRQFDIPGAASAMGISNDGELLATSFGQDAQGNIRVYNLRTGALEGERKTAGAAIYLRVNKEGNVTADIGDVLYHWKSWSDNEGSLPAGISVTQVLRDGGAIAISSDESFLAVYDPQQGKISILDYATGKQKQTWEVGRTPIDDIEFDPANGNYLVSYDRTGSIRIWNVVTRDLSLTLTTSPINTVFYSPDGRLLATNATDGTIRVWDTRDGREVATTTTPRPDTANNVAVDGVNGIVAAKWGDSIQLLQVSEIGFPVLSPIQRPFGIVAELHLAAGTCDWSFLCIVRFQNGDHPALMQKFKPNIMPALGSSAAFSADGQLMAVSRQVNTRANQARASTWPVIWDISTGSQLRSQDGGLPPGFAILGFTPESDSVIVNSLSDSQASMLSGLDQKVEIWNLRQTTLNPTLPPALQSAPASITFSHDGHWLATTNAVPVKSGSVEELRYVVKIWHWPDGRVPLRTLDVGSMVSKMVFSSDHHFLATSAGESFLRIWDTTTQKEVSRVGLYRAGVPLAMMFVDGDRRIIAYDRYSVTNSPWLPKDLKEEVCQRVGRSLTTREWDEFLPGEKYVATCSSDLRGQMASEEN